VQNFREDFLRNGPMVDGIAPNDAVDRLSRFKEEFKIRERKMDSYRGYVRTLECRSTYMRDVIFRSLQYTHNNNYVRFL
jgi:hypothetical protein